MWQIAINFLVSMMACLAAIGLIIGAVLLLWKYEMKKLDPNYRN